LALGWARLGWAKFWLFLFDTRLCGLGDTTIDTAAFYRASLMWFDIVNGMFTEGGWLGSLPKVRHRDNTYIRDREGSGIGINAFEDIIKP
jgi:hypothetical protein